MTHDLSGDHPLVSFISKPRGTPLERAIVHTVGDRIRIEVVSRILNAGKRISQGIYVASAREKHDALVLRVAYKVKGKLHETSGTFPVTNVEEEPTLPGLDQLKSDIEQLPKLSTASTGCRCPNKGRIRVVNVEVVKGEHAGAAPPNSYEISFRAAVEGLSDFKLEERGSATSPSCPTHFCGEECANRPYDPRCAQSQALANLLSNFEAPDARERARAGATPPNILSGRTYTLEAKLKYTADQQGRWSVQSYQTASISPAAHWMAPDRIGNEREANEQPAIPDEDATRPRFACLGGRPGEQCDQPPSRRRELEGHITQEQLEKMQSLALCATEFVPGVGEISAVKPIIKTVMVGSKVLAIIEDPGKTDRYVHLVMEFVPLSACFEHARLVFVGEYKPVSIPPGVKAPEPVPAPMR